MNIFSGTSVSRIFFFQQPFHFEFFFIIYKNTYFLRWIFHWFNILTYLYRNILILYFNIFNEFHFAEKLFVGINSTQEELENQKIHDFRVKAGKHYGYTNACDYVPAKRSLVFLFFIFFYFLVGQDRLESREFRVEREEEEAKERTEEGKPQSSRRDGRLELVRVRVSMKKDPRRTRDSLKTTRVRKLKSWAVSQTTNRWAFVGYTVAYMTDFSSSSSLWIRRSYPVKSNKADAICSFGWIAWRFSFSCFVGCNRTWHWERRRIEFWDFFLWLVFEIARRFYRFYVIIF